MPIHVFTSYQWRPVHGPSRCRGFSPWPMAQAYQQREAPSNGAPREKRVESLGNPVLKDGASTAARPSPVNGTPMQWQNAPLVQLVAKADLCLVQSTGPRAEKASARREPTASMRISRSSCPPISVWGYTVIHISPMRAVAAGLPTRFGIRPSEPRIHTPASSASGAGLSTSRMMRVNR